MVSDAIAKGDVAALNYFIADKYIKAFGQLADSPNQKIIMLPIEATGILGSLAGIGEIAKATFGESAASAQAAARRGSVPSTGHAAAAAATLSSIPVVPAKAGTHNPWRPCLRKASTASSNQRRHGVWVLAFAGTTVNTGVLVRWPRCFRRLAPGTG